MNDTACNKCENLMCPVDTYVCGITLTQIENISEKPSWCPHNKNCHEYCRYGKYCRYVKGSNGADPDECAMYYKLDDLMNEARDIEREQRKALDDYDEWE